MNINETRKDIRNAIRMLQIPRHLHEEAEQEGFVAMLGGHNPVTHLTKWHRREKEFRRKIGVTDNGCLEDPANQENKLNYRIDEVKPIQL